MKKTGQVLAFFLKGVLGLQSDLSISLVLAYQFLIMATNGIKDLRNFVVIIKDKKK